MVDFLYDKNKVEYNPAFANNNGFASGTAAIDYVLGNTTTPATLPGGKIVQVTTDYPGRATFADAVLGYNGFGFNNGNVTKLICVQFIAKETGKVKLAYRMRDISDVDLDSSYVDVNTYQPKGGAKFNHNVKIESSAILGDLNGDGKVSTLDLTLWGRWYAQGQENLTEEQIKLADINGNGRIDIMDKIKLSVLIK